MIEEKKGFFRAYAEVYEVFACVFIVVYGLILLFGIHPKLSVYAALAIFDLVLFLIASPFTDNWRKYMKLFEISIIMICASIPIQLSSMLAASTGKSLPTAIIIVFDLLVIFGGMVFYKYATPKNESLINAYNEKVNKQFIEESVPLDDDSIVLCYDSETGEPITLDVDARYVHMLVIGPTGCGKTSLAFTPMISQDIYNNRGVICIEPKSDLAEMVYAMCTDAGRTGYYFNPISPDCPRFNPLAGKEEDVIETTTTVFVMLAPDSIQYFKDITTNLLRKALMVLKRIEAAYTDYSTGISSRPATLLVLNDLICNTNGIGFQMVNELAALPTINKAEKKQNQDTKEWFINEYFSDRSKIYENASGVRMQVANLIQNKYLRKVLNPENGQSDINFDKILANGDCLSITTAMGDLRDLGSYLGYFIIFNLQSSIFRRPGTEYTRKPCYLYIDEAQKYLNYGFSDVLTMGRSYRVCCTIASQSRDLLVENAGDKAEYFLSNISANLRNVVLFPGISYKDADYYSKAFGKIVKTEIRTGETDQKFSLQSSLSGRVNAGTKSIQYSERETEEYSSSDLTYRTFNYVVYRILNKRTLQRAQKGYMTWIGEDFNERLKGIVRDYKTIQQRKLQAIEEEEYAKRVELYANFQRKNPNIHSKPKERKNISEYTA